MKKLILSAFALFGAINLANSQDFDTWVSETGDNKYVEFNNTSTIGYRISTNNAVFGTPSLDFEYSNGFSEPGGPNYSSVMSIKSFNVGIGTINPASRLHVNGNSYFQGAVGIGTSAPTVQLDVRRDENPAIKIRSNNNGRWVDLGIANCSGCWSGMATDGDVVMRAKPGSNDLVIANQGTGNLILGNGDTGSEVRRLVINSSGNIGIGIDNPSEKLTVDGKILAEEVEVVVNVAAPDYVFEKYYEGISELNADYEMPTLKEVEAFTKANHHLPSIPSAAEIAEDGMQLKEMTLSLLQKIEELTLYTIEQEKRIEKLESELSKK